MKRSGGVDRTSGILNLALDCGEWIAPYTGRFTQKERAPGTN
jgi:hypothetical protein